MMSLTERPDSVAREWFRGWYNDVSEDYTDYKDYLKECFVESHDLLTTLEAAMDAALLGDYDVLLQKQTETMRLFKPAI